MIRAAIGGLIGAIYPPACLSCKEETVTPSGLCAKCWAETIFIAGLCCNSCGVPLPGEAADDALCDACLQSPPAFRHGRAALLYQGGGRRLALALKHGDRLDIVRPLAAWMARAGRDVLAQCDLIAPVPLHWRRLLLRRYNQSAELARNLAKLTGKPVIPDLLVRQRMTPSQDGLNRNERFANQAAAFKVHPRHLAKARGKYVLLIDDVMTTGATLSACAETCLAAGVQQVDALVLARVARDA